MIAANQVPDHATIARFRRDHENAIADLFTAVLALCAKAGLVNGWGDREELHAAGIKSPDVVVADAGYWNGAHMKQLVSHGIQTLLCPEALKRETPRPGRDKGLDAFMRRVLESEAGHALYKQRQAMIEPVFAHIKHNHRADRFQRRGRAACHSEWRLITVVCVRVSCRGEETG